MIENLKRIGLSDLEARCYLALHEEANLSGYEVAKRVSVSRTNVYAALRSLLDKGVIRQSEGDPVTYDAVPVKQLANAIHRLAANADRMIIADIFAEDVPLVEEALLHAEQKGVTVVLICLGDYPAKLRHVFIHKRPDEVPFMDARKFSILCWVCDAIDGAVHFLQKMPMLAMSLCLVQGGAAVASFVYDPCRDEMFSAAAGHGATLNGDPIRVSGKTELSFGRKKGETLRRFTLFPFLFAARGNGALS